MFKTFQGSLRIPKVVYLRPETAQSIFVNSVMLRTTAPSYLWALPRSARRFPEITPGNFVSEPASLSRWNSSSLQNGEDLVVQLLAQLLLRLVAQLRLGEEQLRCATMLRGAVDIARPPATLSTASFGWVSYGASPIARTMTCGVVLGIWRDFTYLDPSQKRYVPFCRAFGGRRASLPRFPDRRLL